MHVNVCLHVYMSTASVPGEHSPEETTNTPGTGVPDSCELPWSARNQTWVLYKSGKCSSPLSPLSILSFETESFIGLKLAG